MPRFLYNTFSSLIRILSIACTKKANRLLQREQTVYKFKETQVPIPLKVTVTRTF